MVEENGTAPCRQWALEIKADTFICKGKGEGMQVSKRSWLYCHILGKVLPFQCWAPEAMKWLVYGDYFAMDPVTVLLFVLGCGMQVNSCMYFY